MINIAQIGCGYWGPNLLRTFNNIDSCKLISVLELSEERRKYVNKNYPNISCSANESLEKILNDGTIDAVVIASPAHLHFEQAKQCLLAGKHVLVEKPMATKISEVIELQHISNQEGLVLMSGHTFIYNDAVRFIKNEFDQGNLGNILYISTQRLNLGKVRSDVDALWNFAPHDVSIVQYLLDNQQPKHISSSGMDFIQKGIDDVVFLNLRYEKTLVNIHVSWLDPLKTRKVIVVGSKKMIVYDDVADDKITVYDKGIDKFSELNQHMDFDTISSVPFRYRSGDIWIPKINFVEPLRRQCKHFLYCIKEGIEPLTGFTHTKGVIRILENAKTI